MEKIQKTVIVGADGNNPEVLFVKSFFKEADVRSDQRVDRTVDVLVGNKYRGFNKEAKTTYQVGANTVCLPSQTPSPTPPLAADRPSAHPPRNLRRRSTVSRSHQMARQPKHSRAVLSRLVQSRRAETTSDTCFTPPRPSASRRADRDAPRLGGVPRCSRAGPQVSR